MTLDKHLHRLIGVILHRWHRRLGLFAGLFVLWLAGSGIVLNHSSDLGLDRAQVSTPWVTRLYGLHAAVPESGFHSGHHWLVGSDVVTVVDGVPLANALPGALGLIAAGEQLFAANASTLVLFDARGQLVDTLRGSDLPIPVIHRIGLGHAEVVIADAQDHRYSSRDGLGFSPYLGEVVWSKREKLPDSVQAEAAPFLRPQIPAERVLLDAHSGHLLGRHGPLLVDAVGVSFILLALSGLWMLIRHHRRHLAHVHARVGETGGG